MLGRGKVNRVEDISEIDHTGVEGLTANTCWQGDKDVTLGGQASIVASKRVLLADQR